jgi:Holliday junction resolvase RusA-like endonuclease
MTTADIMVVIELAGEVVAKGRPRFAMRGPGQRAIAYTPAKTRHYESDLRLAAQHAMDGRPPLTGALIMRVTASLPVPHSWSKKKQREATAGSVQPTKRPDLDNFWKAAADALNLIVFGDDSQIVEIHARKAYSDRPGLRIEIRGAP